MKTKISIGFLVLVVLLGVYMLAVRVPASHPDIKIGVVTPLTGGVAYWGESALIGVKLAEKELTAKGIHVSVLVEDGQLEPTVALNAAQKLVNVDGVDAIYSEFNPAAVAVSSFLQDKNIIQIYDATPVSPLALSENFFKTYLDYEVSCQEVAEVLKKRGYTKVGVLKMNLEHGDLCAKGINAVFGANAVIEAYNPGTLDFRTSLAKLAASDVQVVFHASFQPETVASLKNMRELGMKQLFVGLSETVSPAIVEEYTDVLRGAVMFGLPKISPTLLARLQSVAEGKEIADQNAAALAYLHITELAETFDMCKKDIVCVRKELGNAKPNTDVGFQGFTNRVAGFATLIQEEKDGTFMPIP